MGALMASTQTIVAGLDQAAMPVHHALSMTATMAERPGPNDIGPQRCVVGVLVMVLDISPGHNSC